MFDNGSGRNEHSLQKTFHRCFLPSFGSFDQAVSEEKILKNRPIRNKNCLWRPCLLMDRDKMSNVYRGPSIDVSYQVSVHLAKGFQRRRLKCEKLTDDRRQVMAKAHIALARWGENKWANIIFKNYHIFYLKTVNILITYHHPYFRCHHHLQVGGVHIRHTLLVPQTVYKESSNTHVVIGYVYRVEIHYFLLKVWSEIWCVCSRYI